MKFRPLHDRVVVQRVKEDTKSAGGIIIRIQPQKNPQKAKLLQSVPAFAAMTANLPS